MAQTQAQSVGRSSPVKINQLFGPQYTALTGRRPKIPLSSVIHAQIPAFRMSREAQLDRELAQEAHEKEMAMEEKKLEIAEEEGKKATALGVAQTGMLGAYLAKKGGIIGKEATTIAAGEAATAAAPAAGEAVTTEAVGGVMSPEATIGAGGAQAEAVGTGGVSLPGTGAALAIELVRDPAEEYLESQIGETARGIGHVAIRAGQGYLIGGPIGGAIGAGVGVLEEATDTMLCTELHRQGLLPDHIYQADCEYAKTINTEVVVGYRVWAQHLVPIMEKSKLFTRLVGTFVRAWAYHAAYKAGAVSKDNRFGALIEWVGTPICNVIGKLIFKRAGIRPLGGFRITPIKYKLD